MAGHRHIRRIHGLHQNRWFGHTDVRISLSSPLKRVSVRHRRFVDFEGYRNFERSILRKVNDGVNLFYFLWMGEGVDGWMGKGQGGVG